MELPPFSANILFISPPFFLLTDRGCCCCLAFLYLLAFDGSYCLRLIFIIYCVLCNKSTAVHQEGKEKKQIIIRNFNYLLALFAALMVVEHSSYTFF